MSGQGHVKAFLWGDDNAWEQDFRHPDFHGDSLNWTDNVHFCFYSDHGGNWDNTMHIAFSKAQTHCLATASEWKLGAKMLKWLVLDCCEMVLNTDKNHISATWFPPAHGIHMVFGFIGLSYDCWWTRNVGDEFGYDAARTHTLSNAWLDAAYSWWADCNAILVAYGATEGEALYRRDNECINFRDWNVTSPNWMAWKYRN
jgi:hypothetical protein